MFKSILAFLSHLPLVVFIVFFSFLIGKMISIQEKPIDIMIIQERVENK